MKRCLRIAVSAFFVLLCVGLIVFWIGAHYRYVLTNGQLSGSWACQSVSYCGGMKLVVFKSDSPFDPSWSITSERGDEYRLTDGGTPIDNYLSYFRYVTDSRFPGFGLFMPAWLPLTVCAFLAALPWSPGRFSVRAMFIVITLVGVMLGLICYGSR